MKHFKLMKGVLACLLSLALVFSCFSGVGAQAAEDTTTTVVAPNACEATYNPENDTLVSSTGKVVYVLSKESGNTIKAGAKCYEMSTKAEENTLAAMGVKGTTKDAYFYVCDKQFEAEGTNIKANVVVKAQAAKKIVANIDYTQADKDSSTNVLSITATDSAKKKIEGATCIWSEDGTVWKAATEFTGEKLKKMLEAGGAIQVKMLGTTENGNVRTSKAIKVKIAKMGKAPAVKIDVKKDTFGIKNGMDFAIFTKSGNGETYTNISGWRTVLPNLKTAKIKTVEDSIVATSGEYLPLDKKDTAATNDVKANKVSYTQAKVKAIGYKTINALVSASSGSITEGSKIYLGVRSSATSKKPASAVTYVEYTAKTKAPIVYTESCVSGQYLIASGKEFAKKGFTLSTIANYNGENGTTGFDDSFELLKNNQGADTNTASYEYTIVKKSDLGDFAGSGETIDWTSVAWKKLDPAKTKINGKLKSKYVTTAGTKVTAELKAGSISGAPTAAVPTDIQTVMLVRRAGVKGSVLASDYQILYVAKDGSDFGIYSTKSVGEAAWKYTVKFAKYEAPSTSSSGGWTVVSDISEISVWMQPGKAKYVELPKIDGAALFEATGTPAGSGVTITASTSGVATVADGTNKGKYQVALSTSGDATEYIAVKQYANIKVVATGSGETVPEKEIGLVKAGKISSVSGDKLNAGTDVTAYVGEAVNIGVINYVAPTGYVTSGSGVVTATGTGYKDASFNGTLTVTATTADEVTVIVKYPVVKTYTIKFDANGATGTLATTSLTTDKDGKIELPDEATGLTAPNGKTFKGWGLATDTADSAKQTSNSTYTADTTLYAIWAES